MRAFLALSPDKNARKYLEEYSKRTQKLAAGRSWVPPENYHITLRFLGDIGKVDEICRAVDKVCDVFKPFPLGLKGVRSIARSKNAMLIACIDDPEKQLQALYNAMQNALEELGFLPEKRPFRPHITLARAISVQDVVRFVEDWEDGPSWSVQKLTFYESERRDRHMVYTPIYTRAFFGAE